MCDDLADDNAPFDVEIRDSARFFAIGKDGDVETLITRQTSICTVLGNRVHRVCVRVCVSRSWFESGGGGKDGIGFPLSRAGVTISSIFIRIVFEDPLWESFFFFLLSVEYS